MKENKLASFLKWFWFGDDSNQVDRGKKIVADYLRDYFKKCPVCEETFGGHLFTRITCIVKSPKNDFQVENFIREFRRNNWTAIKDFEQFDSQEDVLVVQIIKCPQSRSVKLLSLEPYDLDEPYQVVEYEVLSELESEMLFETISVNTWDKFS